MTAKTVTTPPETLVSEDEIIRLAQSDPQAFRPLYERHFKTIFLFVLHRVGDKELAADVTQQVFLNALTNIGRFQFRGLPFSAWLYRIAINQCNDFFRKTKRARTVVLEDSSVEHLVEELTADTTLEEWQKKLPAILQKLKPDDLQVIELRFFEGRAFKEIAAILGITETYAKVRTYRILERMKKLFLQQK